LAASDLHREVGRLTQTLPPAARGLTLHIGVNTGHVVTGVRGGTAQIDYSLLGDAVNVAQRLEAASGSGEVYVGELTYQLARAAMRFEEVGELKLKGKTEPVRAWRFLPAQRAGLSNEADVAFGPILGRETEVAMLTELFDSAVRSERRIVALIGEPGIGKSRLLLEARANAQRAGARWLQTRCLSYGTGLPYWPFVELLRVTADVGADDAPDQVAAKVQAAAEPVGAQALVPYLLLLMGIDVADDIPTGIRTNPEALRHHTREAIVGLLLALAAQSALVVAIEDLHWIDSASLDLIGLLRQRSTTVPLSIAVTARPEGEAAVDQAFADDPSVVLLHVSDLTRHAIAGVIANVLGSPAGEELIDIVVSRCSGNVLFAQEVVRSLLESNALVARSTGWQLDASNQASAVPVSIESVLGARLDALPPDAAELLQTASVIGRNVPLELLRGVTTLSLEAIDSTMQLLVDRSLLTKLPSDDSRYAFTHALVVEVAYGRVLRRNRREIHRQILEAGAALYGSGDDVIDLLAHHAYRAGIGADALPYLRRAADRAARLFANDEAIKLLDAALEIAQTDATAADDVSDILVQLASLHELIAELDRALDLYGQVVARTPDLRGFLGQASTLGKLGRYADSHAAIDAAEHAHPDLSAEERALIASARSYPLVSTGETHRAYDVLAQALVDVEGTDSPIEARILVSLSRTEQLLGMVGPAIAHARRASEVFDAQGDLAHLATALRTLGGAIHDRANDTGGSTAEAVGVLQRARAVAQQVGNVEEEAAVLINLGYLKFESDRFEEAVEHDRDAITAFDSIGIKAGVACGYCNLADALLGLGHVDEAEQAAHNGLAVAESIGHRSWTAGALWGLAEVRERRGDYDGAAEYFDRIAEIRAEIGDSRAEAARTRADKAHRLSRGARR
ncbi:MAG: hypothetical protein QOG80_1784, partial [Pseudonocardiales bacterium]|nr:hypothetical protein [Pseudonocardiales bacterium]